MIKNATIGHLRKLNKEDKNFFIEYIIDLIGHKVDVYTTIPIKTITFSYKFREGKAPSKIIDNKKIKFQTWYNNKLPIAFNPNEYGEIMEQSNNTWTIAITNKITVTIKRINRKKNNINLVKYYKNDILLYEWKDTLTNPNSFIREIGKSIYYYENGELTLVKITKKTNPLIKTNIEKS